MFTIVLLNSLIYYQYVDPLDCFDISAISAKYVGNKYLLISMFILRFASSFTIYYNNDRYDSSEISKVSKVLIVLKCIFSGYLAKR